MEINEIKHHHHHHHHRHEEHLDDGEAFKRSALGARKRRRLIANFVFGLLCLLAIAIFTFLLWAVKSGE